MIREQDVIKQEKNWAKEKNLLERKIKIKQEKKAILSSKKKSTTKLIVAFLFLNCTLIELFTGWITVKSIYLSQYTGMAPDFSPIVTLIGAVVSEVIGFAIYAVKSAKENSEGGITYELAMLEQQGIKEEDVKG